MQKNKSKFHHMEKTLNFKPIFLPFLFRLFSHFQMESEQDIFPIYIFDPAYDIRLDDVLT